MTSTYAAARDISQVSNTMNNIPGVEGGMDYEKIESARLLTSSEYTLNSKLGYISLNKPCNRMKCWQSLLNTHWGDGVIR